MKKIVATIEARMNSTRLPGKVIKNIGSLKSLELQINRLKRSNYISEIVLATTANNSDNILQDFAEQLNIPVFRGSEDDVLARILGASMSVNADIQVQITGDCPLIDPAIVDLVIKTYIESDNEYDFVSNEITRSFPIGLDCRVFSVELLKKIDLLCDDPVHRVHGTTYIYAGPGREMFTSKNIFASQTLNHPDWRWTLDTPEDLLFLREIAKHYNDKITELGSEELAGWLLSNPEILKVNQTIQQKALEDG